MHQHPRFCLSNQDLPQRSQESRYWLNLLFIEQDSPLNSERLALADEADQLARIFGAIVRKKESPVTPQPATKP